MKRRIACFPLATRICSSMLIFHTLLLCSLSFSGVAKAQKISTVAGGGPAGGTAQTAFIAYPSSVVKDSAGNTYISSNYGHYVYKLSTAGALTVFAGKGYAGFSGDNGLAINAALNLPAGLAIDKAGNLYIADSGNNRIRPVAAATGKITTVAGSGPANRFFQGSYSGDGGPAIQARLNAPLTAAVDGQGNLFISDEANFRIRRVDSKTKVITTVAGTGKGGYGGDGGPATSAEIFYAITVTVDKSDDLYIADSGNNRIRRVDGKTQVITTVAGDGTGGFKGDGGPATQAELSFPNAVTEDYAGNLYVIDTGNNRVRKVNLKGIIKTYVGTGIAGFSGDGGPGTKAEISDSSGGYVDASDNLLIADSGNQRVRIINTGDIINTIAGGGSGGDKGPAKKALLSYPVGVAIDGSGNLFIAESGTPVIREVSAQGTITTVAGSGTEGFSGDNGPALKADFFGLSSVAVNNIGDIFIADTYNARVRRVDHVTHKVTTFVGDGKFCSAPPCGDGGQAVNASISEPGSVAVDSSGNVYIADPYDSVIRRVDAQSRIISSVAGNYVASTTLTSPCCDNGSATSANLYFPFGVAVDASGNIFIADTGDNRVRRVDAKSGIITAAVFNGQYNISGDGGPALDASMALPLSVAVDSADNIFISGGYDFTFGLGAGIELVQKVDAATQIVSTACGAI
jgi:sugar lactone lactonase YvrE